MPDCGVVRPATNSVAATRTARPRTPVSTSQCSRPSGLRAGARRLEREGGRPFSIQRNTVAPGGLDDDFNADLFAEMPGARDYIKGNTALGRIGMPTDVAGVIAFLCREEAGFVSGATINVDGGYHL